MTDNAVLILTVSAAVGAVYLFGGDAGLADTFNAASASAPAPLQQSPSVDRNYTSVVADAKAQLQAQGVNLDGPCGAFAITRLAAQLIGGECGILDKPAGNNCDGYAVDIHVFRDGLHYDVLGDGGDANTPQYSLIGPVDVSRWRQP